MDFIIDNFVDSPMSWCPRISLCRCVGFNALSVCLCVLSEFELNWMTTDCYVLFGMMIPSQSWPALHPWSHNLYSHDFEYNWQILFQFYIFKMIWLTEWNIKKCSWRPTMYDRSPCRFQCVWTLMNFYINLLKYNFWHLNGLFMLWYEWLPGFQFFFWFNYQFWWKLLLIGHCLFYQWLYSNWRYSVATFYINIWRMWISFIVISVGNNICRI